CAATSPPSGGRTAHRSPRAPCTTTRAREHFERERRPSLVLHPEPEARNDRDPGLVTHLAEVVVVEEPLDRRMVVGVLHVEVDAHPGFLELPRLVDAQIEWVPEREALTELLAVALRVRAGVGGIEGGQRRRRYDGRVERARDEREARAELPPATEPVAPEHGEVGR